MKFEAGGEKFEVKFLALGLVGFMSLIYLLEISIPGLAQSLSLEPSVFLQEPWTILTSIFAHSDTDIMHLVNNMFWLSIFGTVLERWIGSKRFIILFLASGVVANISAFTFYFNSTVLGASGAVSGVIFALAVLKPRSLGFSMGAPMPMWGVAVIWFLTNALMSLADVSGIASEAHIYGAIFGVIAGLYWKEGLDLKTKKDKKAREVKKAEEVEIPEEYIREWERKYLVDQD